MSREVRRVPADWKHPERSPGRYEPMFEGNPTLDEDIEQWHKDNELWKAGKHPAQHDPKCPSAARCENFEDWDGGPPDPDRYMPFWPLEQRTHYQMYETTTEGTPISPVMSNPEELAHWLADNKASAFGREGASYEEWLRMIMGPGWAPSMARIGGELMSGVAYMGKKDG
jgi:hypothetical protein